MAFCENCGKEMSDEAVSCPNCGHPRRAAGMAMPGIGASAPIMPAGQRATEWWKRLVAIIIDGIIVAVPTFVIAGFLGLSGGAVPGSGVPTAPNGVFLGFSPGMWLFIVVVNVLYYGLLNGGDRGQTVGKMALKIQVRDIETGGPIGYGRGFIRTLIPSVISNFTCGLLGLIDGLWPLWDPRRQALHDKMANSIVVDVP